MKKQIFAGVLSLAIVLSSTISFANTSEPSDLGKINNSSEQISLKGDNSDKPNLINIKIPQIVVGNKIVDLEGLTPYYKDSTLMVPLRKVAQDELGFEVIWNNSEKSIELKKGAQWTKIVIGENSYFFAKVAPFKLTSAPEIVKDSTFVPVEFFRDVLKYGVSIEDGSVIIKNDDVEETTLNGFVKDIVKDKDNKKILVAGDENTVGLDEILLNINEETKILDINDKVVPFEDLKVGTKVKVVVPPIITMSIPAQGLATKIIVVEKPSFEIVKKEIKVDEKKMSIKYPEIQGMQGELTQDYLNQSIKNFANSIKENDLYKNLKLDYEISLLTDEQISIIFRGSFDFADGNKRNIVKSLNLDLKSTNKITFENCCKSDAASQQKLKALLNEKAKKNGLGEFEAEGVSIYFKGGNVVVFYYPLDDSYVMPVELYLPLNEIKDIVNKDFGEHPAS